MPPWATLLAMNEFEGKAVLVTGGATGLGAAIAGAFAAAGARVAVFDIDEAAGQALALRLGPNAFFSRTDVTADEQLREGLRRIDERFGRLDFLVNNACLYADEGLASERSLWLRALDVNLVSGAVLLREALPLLRRQGGAVVNLSSIAGKIGQAERAVYPSCKAAILQLTRNEAAALAPHGIRVNAVTPAWTWSPALEQLAGGDRAVADAVGSRLHPLGRVGDAQDVAGAVLFLCSDAARFVTGIDLPVDGGYAVLGPEQGRLPGAWFAQAREAGLQAK